MRFCSCSNNKLGPNSSVEDKLHPCAPPLLSPFNVPRLDVTKNREFRPDNYDRTIHKQGGLKEGGAQTFNSWILMSFSSAFSALHLIARLCASVIKTSAQVRVTNN